MAKTVITEEVFNDWLQHPVTEALRREILPAKVGQLHQAWENGQLTAESFEGTMQQNAKAIGETKTLRWFAEIDWEVYEMELTDARK